MRLSRIGSIVSDAVLKPTKISREGVILIKSFEGFRPRAIQRSDGRWTIGYGHLRSARQGASITEAEAELLLQYDLLPVAKAVKSVQAPLNQHQFDALASFAFSVGVDRFETSDVLSLLNAGETDLAVEALSAWSDDSAIASPPRRRAAERALFHAAPDAPVSLAELLAAPLPPPVAVVAESTGSEKPTAFDASGVAPFPAVGSAIGASSSAANFYTPYAQRAFGPLQGIGAAAPDLAEDTTPPVANDIHPAEDAGLSPSEPAEAEPIQRNASGDATVADGSTLETFTAVADESPSSEALPLTSTENEIAPASIVTETPDESQSEGQSPDLLRSAVDDVTPQAPDDASPTPETSSGQETPWSPAADGLGHLDQASLFDAEANDAKFVTSSDDAKPARSAHWGETATFLVMGGIGMLALGAAMAAFRQSAASGSGETTLIGWVLALIAVACVGVSVYNLYQRWGRDDRH